MTLPDPKAPAAEKNEFMSRWYYPAISNVSVHEVWPGHYPQFLYARGFPSDIRKVLGAATNSEGWAHYCEQMVIDEGFHADDPRYRLAQLQDALLRVKDGYQSRPVARSESKRGTSDPTRLGSRFSLQDFHDTFIKLGPLPLPLVRKAMLGETGRLF